MRRRTLILCLVLVALALATASIPIIAASKSSELGGVSAQGWGASSCSEDQGECVDGNDGCSYSCKRAK
jgi:hypothetical protein